MRFLIDAQLPPALARVLCDAGHQAEHVFDVGLASAGDTQVWDHARSNGAAVITKDEDFPRRLRDVDSGISIVWVRVGNTTRRQLLDWFVPLIPLVVKMVKDGEHLIELR